jgi:hypothetical protein
MAEISAQVRTYALGADNVTYFEVVTTDFSDGSQDVRKRPIGKTPVLLQISCDAIKNESAAMANDARGILIIRARLSDMRAGGAAIKAIIGTDPMDKIQADHQAELLTPGWTIDEGSGTFVPIVFTVTGQGVLKYSVSGGTTKNARIYGDVIQLLNYPAAPTDTEFFVNESGKRYFSLPNKTVTIKKP